MLFVSIRMAALLVCTSLSTSFHFSRSPLARGSKIPKSVVLSTIGSDETNVKSGLSLDVSGELELTTSKLKVLEYVVKTMKRKSNESSASWERRLVEEGEQYTKTLGELESLQMKFSDAEISLVEQRNRYERQIETMTSEYDASLKEYKQQISDLTKRETLYQHNVRRLDVEVIEMEGTLADVAEEKGKLKTTLNSERKKHKSILDDQYRKHEHLSAELAKIRAERDEILVTLEADQKQINSVDSEAVEIAKHSAAAADRRESMLKVKYTALQVEYDRSQKTIQDLQKRLSTMIESNRSLEEKVQTASAASKATDDELLENIETLTKTILEMRTRHSSQLRKQQRETDSLIAKMKDDHYKQVQQFRTALMERNDTFERKGPWQRVRKLLRRR